MFIAGRVKAGHAFALLTELKTHALTSWAAPYTGSEACTLPAGTIFVAEHDQVEGARGFVVVAKNYAELEQLVIPQATRNDPKYGGYYFVFLLADIGKTLQAVELPNA